MNNYVANSMHIGLFKWEFDCEFVFRRFDSYENYTIVEEFIFHLNNFSGWAGGRKKWFKW